MLLAAREASIDRVVYTGSTSVYGNPRSIPINEDDGIAPLSPYAVSKLAGEHYCLAFYESYGLPVAVVRYSNVYGAGQRPDNPYCGVVAKFFARPTPASRSRSTATASRRATSRTSTTRSTRRCSRRSARAPRARCSTSARASRRRSTSSSRRIGAAHRRDVEVDHIDRRDIDNIRRRVVNIEKARRMLRWAPQVTLADGLGRTARWIEATGIELPERERAAT